MSMQLWVSLRLAWVIQHIQCHLLTPGLCHILLKQGAVWLQYRISPFIFNFLLVYVTALTLLKPDPMWLPGAQAAIPGSWRATQQGLATAGRGPAQHLPSLSGLWPGVHLVSLWGLWAWMGQEGSTTCRERLRRDDLVLWGGACPSGAM